jgi:hypothetical protein
MTDYRIIATPRDNAQTTATMHGIAREMQAAGMPVLSVASTGVSFMPGAGYEIVLGDPGCRIVVPARSPDRIVSAVGDALRIHEAAIAAERNARADIRTTLADACVLAGLLTGRRYPDEARRIAGLPTITIDVEGAKFTGGTGSYSLQVGQPVMAWQRRAIRASLDTAGATYSGDVLTVRRDMQVPDALLISCVGRPVEHLVDFAPFRRQAVEIARAWVQVDSKGVGRLKIRVRSASLSLYEAAKAIDRVHDLARMGRAA